ncbi:MAG: UDP-N-acetylglucosamine 1-carboxyvinyltransferase, partial [Candidatus Pacebacteria bacterium]|nr:UDP-N-acetylglucosamine 1-carboxyvinyltransferase [Candidatus Paceibacterota bacterium]
LIIGALCGGKVKVKNIEGDYLDLFLEKLEEMGIEYQKGDNYIEIQGGANLKPVKIQALPYPGFPTDLLPLVVPLLTQAKGKSLLHDPLYENRLNYIHQLRKMGGDIEIVDPHRAFVFGPTELSGVSIESWDIRAGACLIIAGLLAQGTTTIENINQVDRGYENIEERLQKLGADITRMTN